jgi:endo-1,4-beta-xylanase
MLYKHFYSKAQFICQFAVISSIIITVLVSDDLFAQKFVGNIFQSSAPSSFTTYWNQVTPENSGKWGSVEASRDNMNWGPLDNAYNYAKQRGFPFKQHTFVWGAQEPSWIGSLSQSEQRAEVEEWIQLYGQRYPNTDYIDVVNEPLHQPASYRAALGGSGSTGWDWIITAFQMARQYCPNAKLLINEYGIISDPNAANNYVNIINILKNRGLIDGIGIQCHAFNMDNVSTSTMNQVLNILSATGLPIYVSELDINGDDNTQLQRYQQKFPVFWNNSNVKGITFWGYIEGAIWQTQAYLLRSNGTERPALTWLMNYVGSSGGDEHVWLEAECGSVGSLWNTVSDGNASNDEYVTIQSGNNSLNNAPTIASAQIALPFDVDESGTYTLWARVIAPTPNDDSFWIRMDDGSWFMWNNITPSSSWTWDDCQTYTLNSGSHTLSVAYREDGTRLDKIYLTNSGSTPSGEGSAANNCAACDPTPIVPYVQINGGSWQQTASASVNAGDDVAFGPQPASGGYWSWSGPNGFSASTREISLNNVQTSQAGNYVATYTNDCGTQSYQTFVLSVTGGSGDVHVWLESECGIVGSLWNIPSDGNASEGTYVTIQSGYNSLSSAPTSTSGQIALPFSVGSSGTYTLWARIIAPTPNDDSFWIRMDSGTWFMWNNITPSSSWTWDDCQTYSLSAGSHTLTVAYREDGTRLDKIYLTNTSNTPSGLGSSATNCSSTGNTIVVRARGNTGSETVELELNDNTVQTWNVTTSYQSFTYTTSLTSANIKVYFDDAGGGSNDVQVDYIQVNGTTLQAENQATNTGVWQNGGCGGSYSEWLHCEGYIDFGTLNLAKAAMQEEFAEEVVVTPEKFTLEQNHPNPFNPITTISFSLTEDYFVSLKVYNSLGEEITELAGKNYSSGRHTVKFNATDLPSGMYFYVLRAGKFTTTRKMLLVR